VVGKTPEAAVPVWHGVPPRGKRLKAPAPPRFWQEPV
jgi:hypothetical protein